MKAGDTFLILAEAPKRHLWAIISDPEVDSLQVVFVHFTSRRAKGDHTCLVAAGEHPFIQHESCIAYREARCEPLSKLEELRGRLGLQMKEPLSGRLLQRIREGARDSDFTRLVHRRILTEQGVIGLDDE